MQFTNTAYNRLKFFALVILPGFAAAYFSLAQIWDLPNADKVVGTATVIDTLLGLLLKQSSSNYHKQGGGTHGDLVVQEDEGQRYLSLAINQDELIAIPERETVTLRVVDQT